MIRDPRATRDAPAGLSHMIEHVSSAIDKRPMETDEKRQCKELLGMLLSWDPKQRLLAEDARQHNWVKVVEDPVKERKRDRCKTKTEL